jgi:hypothetical protein
MFEINKCWTQTQYLIHLALQESQWYKTTGPNVFSAPYYKEKCYLLFQQLLN